MRDEDDVGGTGMPLAARTEAVCSPRVGAGARGLESKSWKSTGEATVCGITPLGMGTNVPAAMTCGSEMTSRTVWMGAQTRSCLPNSVALYNFFNK